MKLFLLGALTVFAGIVLASANYYPMKMIYPIYKPCTGYMCYNSIFAILICLFVFIIVVRVLFGGFLNNDGGGGKGSYNDY